VFGNDIKIEITFMKTKLSDQPNFGEMLATKQVGIFCFSAC
jgi:hypothetical protein